MSTATQVRPFRVEVSDEALADVRRRVTATRWPDPETVSDQSQGVQIGGLQELGRYWGTGYGRRIGNWAERAYTQLIYFNEVDRGGHFAAWEQPELFTDEVRVAFRPLR